MLRPATPLSILFFASFVLTLLSSLSTPIIKPIALASFQGFNFGVFGYCKEDDCSGFRVGYDTDGLFTGSDRDGEFSLPSGTRHSIASLLIVHPIAAFMTLICFGLAVAAHFHAPSHSPRFLLGLLIFTFPTLLICLLAFLVDILLFVPHMQWGGWIVLAATIIITVSGMVTCAMRRTLVSRKARKKRIAENAEMSGENYYASRTEPVPRAESPPPIGSSAGPTPGFAAFEMANKKNGRSDEDTTPLNPTESASRRDGDITGGARQQGNNVLGPGDPAFRSGPSPVGRMRSPGRDQYGNLLPSPAGPGSGTGPGPGYGDPRGIMHQHSNGRMGPNRAVNATPHPSRGRGFNGRGGHLGRGGFGRGGPGMRVPPPPGWQGNSQNMGPMRGAAGVMMGRGQRGPPPGYDPGQPGFPPPHMREPPAAHIPYTQPHAPNGYPPPMMPDSPIGQALTVDSRTGSPMGFQYGLRDNDSEIEGLIGLQQQRREDTPPQGNRADVVSPASPYGSEYTAPRAAWNQRGLTNSSLGLATTDGASREPAPIQPSPVELDARAGTSNLIPANLTSTNHQRLDSTDDYYDDVEPRFATGSNTYLPARTNTPSDRNQSHPNALLAGYPSTPPPQPLPQPPSQSTSPTAHLRPPPLKPTRSSPDSDRDRIRRPSDDSYHDDHSVARSPVESESSHYTSVSQRANEVDWRPPQQQQQRQNMYQPQYQHQRQDAVLRGNPDFDGGVRGMGRDGLVNGGVGGYGGGMGGGYAYGSPGGGGRGGGRTDEVGLGRNGRYGDAI